MGKSQSVNTRGIDHLAIVTDDMPAAMDFYTRVMGFALVHVRRVPYEEDRWQPPTDRSGQKCGVVESVLQTGDEARAELATLYSDPAEVEKWLARMRMK